MARESLGIEVSDGDLVLAHLRGGLRSVKVAAWSRQPIDGWRSPREWRETVRDRITDFMAVHRIRTTEIYLAVPVETAIFRPVTLPAAAKEDLRSTLEFEMEKYVPLASDNVYFDYHLRSEDREAGTLDLLLVVAKRESIRRYIELGESLPAPFAAIEPRTTAVANAVSYGGGDGADPASMLDGQQPPDFSDLDFTDAGVENPAILGAFGAGLKGLRRTPLRINLLPRELRRRPSRAGYYLMIFLVLLTCLAGMGWAGSQVWRQRMVAKTLDGELRTLTATLMDLEAQRARYDAVRERIRFLGRVRDGAPPAIDILRELTDIIPETAWVHQISVSDGRVEMDGYAAAASELIGLLEASPIFQNAEFLSAITRGRDGKDRFRIGLDLASRGEDAG